MCGQGPRQSNQRWLRAVSLWSCLCSWGTAQFVYNKFLNVDWDPKIAWKSKGILRFIKCGSPARVIRGDDSSSSIQGRCPVKWIRQWADVKGFHWFYYPNRHQEGAGLVVQSNGLLETQLKHFWKIALYKIRRFILYDVRNVLHWTFSNPSFQSCHLFALSFTKPRNFSISGSQTLPLFC